MGGCAPYPCQGASHGARAWREVDLAALRHNAQVLMEALGGCSLMAVLKADAYGHGAGKVAKALRRCGVRAFAVATVAEGVALRRAFVRGEILVLGYTPPEQAYLLRRWRLSQAVVDEAHAKALAAAGRRVRVHLALDTGMHRLGIPAQDIAAILRVYGMKNLRVQGIFFAPVRQRHADAAGRGIHALADAKFSARSAGCACGGLRARAGAPAGQLRCAERRGAELYLRARGHCAVWRAERHHPHGAAPSTAPGAGIACPCGQCALAETGAGGRLRAGFVARRPTRLACVAIGYADGVPRDFALRGGQVLVCGQRAPAVGRVCMDQMLVDVTEIEDVRPASVVTLIGTDGGQTLRAEEFAAMCGTITNEALTRLSARVPFVWKG